MDEDEGVVGDHDGGGEEEGHGDLAFSFAVQGDQSDEAHDAGADHSRRSADKERKEDDTHSGEDDGWPSSQGFEKSHEDGDDEGDIVARDSDDVRQSSDAKVFAELVGDALARSEQQSGHKGAVGFSGEGPVHGVLETEFAAEHEAHELLPKAGLLGIKGLGAFHIRAVHHRMDPVSSQVSCVIEGLKLSWGEKITADLEGISVVILGILPGGDEHLSLGGLVDVDGVVDLVATDVGFGRNLSREVDRIAFFTGLPVDGLRGGDVLVELGL